MREAAPAVSAAAITATTVLPALIPVPTLPPVSGLPSLVHVLPAPVWHPPLVAVLPVVGAQRRRRERVREAAPAVSAAAITATTASTATTATAAATALGEGRHVCALVRCLMGETPAADTDTRRAAADGAAKAAEFPAHAHGRVVG